MSAMIINIGVSGESTNISWHVCSASSSFRLWSAIFPFFSPFFFQFLCSILTSVLKKKKLVIPKLCQASFLFPPFFLLPWRFHDRTLAIWRWKGWNHPDSCPATEPLKLTDKAVRLHFDSNCQSKLALPFTINKRQHKVPLQPVSEPSNCSPFQKHNTELYLVSIFLPSQYVCLLIFLTPFSLFPSVSIVELAVFTLMETLLSVGRYVWCQRKTKKLVVVF